jgi:hypothetical protein
MQLLKEKGQRDKHSSTKHYKIMLEIDQHDEDEVAPLGAPVALLLLQPRS